MQEVTGSGIWSAHLRFGDPAEVSDAASELDELGYTALWIPDAGATSSGRTSLLLSALASRTAEGEVCALVDARDSFDPLTGSAAGIALGKLLWVRCQNIDQALRSMDLLIQAGGFGMVAVDLSDVPTKTVRQVTLNA